MSHYIDPRSKLYSHIDRIASLQHGKLIPPVNVEVDVSNRCNLGCVDCHFGHLHSRGPLAGALPNGYVETGDLMDAALLRDLPETLKKWGVRSVTWTGGGEPTLHDQLPGALISANSLLDQGLYTNATLINAALAQIIRRTCEWVYVSLDRASPKSYMQDKGVDAYSDAIAGIEHLVNAPGKATVGVGFLLDATNWHEAPDMIRLTRSLGADYVQFRPKVITDPTEPLTVVEDLGWIEQFLANARLQDFAAMKDVILDESRFRMLQDWKGHGYDECLWCALQAVITPDGKMWVCVNRRGQPAAYLGSLHEDSPELLWMKRQEALPEAVVSGCRVFCRGHIPNLQLHEMLRDKPHRNFI